MREHSSSKNFLQYNGNFFYFDELDRKLVEFYSFIVEYSQESGPLLSREDQLQVIADCFYQGESLDLDETAWVSGLLNLPNTATRVVVLFLKWDGRRWMVLDSVW
jgi:hypothetical protein